MMRGCSLAAALLVAVAQTPANEPDWEVMPYTPHAEFQAVDGDGAGTYPVMDGDPVRMRGVLLNRSAEMLDPTPGAPGFLGGLWQVYVQTIDEDDFGGTACWMGQYLGKIMGTHPEGSYTDEEWLAELDRLEHDAATGHEFEPGDLVEIRARAPGLHFRGKTNINEQHSDHPLADFDIVLLDAGYGLPWPAVITLEELKDAEDAFLFDPTRETGPEHYQGMRVRINGVTLVDATDWGPGADLLITDDSGRTFPIKLGLGGGYDTYDAPTGAFDAVGVLDQEDLDAGDGLVDGYRLWLMADYDGNGRVLPIPCPAGDLDGDGDVDLDDAGGFHGCMAGPDAAPAPPPPMTTEDCLDELDFDADGDVDLGDAATFARAFGQE